MTLFREESLHSHRQSWLGSIHVMQPLGLVWLTFGVLATLVAASTFFFCAEVGRRVTLTGVLLPDKGLVRVTAPADGTLLALSVQEDQTVLRGQPLLTLLEVPSSTGAGARLGDQETIEARARSLAEAARQTTSLLALKQTAARERLAVLAKELVQWETQARWLQQRLELAQQAQERLRQLREQQFASEAQEQAQAETVLGLRADLAAIERQRQALLRERRELEAEQRQAPLQTAQQVGEFERSRDELREQSLRADAAWLGQQPVLAPLAAQVSHLPVSVGQSVNQGNVLAWLTPQGAQLQALLYAPSRAIGLLRAGQEVRLRVQAFAYQRYGWLRGRIQRVAQAPARDDELWPVATSTDAAREPLYRVTVTLERQTMSNPAGGTLPLRTGMLLDADVLLERRTLFAWAFESLPIGR